MGARPRIEIAPDNPFVFRVAVRPPADADAYFEHDLNEIITAHKPAHAGYQLEILRCATSSALRLATIGWRR